MYYLCAPETEEPFGVEVYRMITGSCPGQKARKSVCLGTVMEKLSCQLCTGFLQEGVRLHEIIATSLGSESGSETDRA